MDLLIICFAATNLIPLHKKQKKQRYDIRFFWQETYHRSTVSSNKG